MIQYKITGIDRINSAKGGGHLLRLNLQNRRGGATFFPFCHPVWTDMSSNYFPFGATPLRKI